MIYKPSDMETRQKYQEEIVSKLHRLDEEAIQRNVGTVKKEKQKNWKQLGERISEN